MLRDSNSNAPTFRSCRLSDPAAVSQAAADWVVRCDRGLSVEERCAFEAWRKADPRHAVELVRLGRAWNDFDELRKVTALSAMADHVVARARARRLARQAWWAWSLAGASAAVIAFGVFSWQLRPTESEILLRTDRENYRVLASTLQRMTLADGSVAELNGTSRVEVNYTPTERHVRLVEGEAHFVVAPNPDRPFFVTAGSVTVRAVGTAFNVRLAAQSIEVLVTEGKVKLEHHEMASLTVASTGSTSNPHSPSSEHLTEGAKQELSPALVKGQRAVIPRTVAAKRSIHSPVAIADVGQAEIEEVLGWQTTRLVFNNTPLHEVLNGFNRYNEHRLTIGDPAIRNRTLTGVFRADNLEGFLRLLQHTVDVKAERRTQAETLLLSSR